MEKINNLIQRLIEDLPLERNHIPFYNFVCGKMQEYLELLNELPETEFRDFLSASKEMYGSASKTRFIHLMKAIQDYCIAILNSACRGDNYNALLMLKKLLWYQKYTQNKLKDRYVHYLRSNRYSVDFYRCVDFPESMNLDEVNCWNLPFDMRYKARRNRFNQLGNICFYAASSEECAYSEIGETEEGNKRWIGRFRQKDNLYYLDFTLPNIKTMSTYDKFSFLVTYPLQLLCLVKVENANAKYCEEYLFSQLFFHTLFFHFNSSFPKLDGILYVSMNDRNAVCVVVPALYDSKKPPTEGYSKHVQSLFKQVSIQQYKNFNHETH